MTHVRRMKISKLNVARKERQSIQHHQALQTPLPMHCWPAGQQKNGTTQMELGVLQHSRPPQHLRSLTQQ